VSAILITTSGLRSPCAVENEGSVSHVARTDGLIAGSLVLSFRELSVPEGFVRRERDDWRRLAAAMGGV